MKSTLSRSLALVLALLLALGAFTALAEAPNAKTIAINAKNFPDAIFRAYVQKKFDKDGNKKLDAAEIMKITKINVSEKDELGSLKGVEHFTALKVLNAYRTGIESLDVSKNTELRELDVSETPLKTLKLGKLKKLYALNATYIYGLTSIDIGGCPKLISNVKNADSITFGDEMISWVAGKDWYVTIDQTTKLMNGKTLLRKYAKPKSIKFTKTALTIKRDKGGVNLWSLLKVEPSTAVYPIKFSTSKKSVGEIWDGYFEDSKKGTTTITATVGSKKTTLKLTVK